MSYNGGTVVLKIDCKWFKTFPYRIRNKIIEDYKLKVEKREDILRELVIHDQSKNVGKS